MTEHQKREARRRRDKGADSLADICRTYNEKGWVFIVLTTSLTAARVTSPVSPPAMTSS
jgi:hypothetical protein